MKKKKKLPDSPDEASFPLKRMCNGPLPTLQLLVSMCVCSLSLDDWRGETHNRQTDKRQDKRRVEGGCIYTTAGAVRLQGGVGPPFHKRKEKPEA